MTTTSAIYWDPFDEVIDESIRTRSGGGCATRCRSIATTRYDFWALSRHADVQAAPVDPQHLHLRTGHRARDDGQRHERHRADHLHGSAGAHEDARAGLQGVHPRPGRRARGPDPRDLCRSCSTPRSAAAASTSVEDFGAQLPSMVISVAARRLARRTGREVLDLINTTFTIEPGVGMINEVALRTHRSALHGYIEGQLAERRRQPTDDLMTALTEAELEEGARPAGSPTRRRQTSRPARHRRRHRDGRPAARLGRGDAGRTSRSARRPGRRCLADPERGRGTAPLRGALAGAGPDQHDRRQLARRDHPGSGRRSCC